eukprot:493945_1
MSSLLYMLVIIYTLTTIINGLDSKLYLDPTQPISVRVDDLLKQMNLNEKMYQLLSVNKIQTSNPYGLGIIKGSGNTPSDIIKNRNTNQQTIIKQSRLNIPVAFHQEALHSCCPGGTVFPMPVLQGCTWNNTIIKQIAKVIAYESRTVGNQILYSPVINLWTDPRFGRLSEGYSSNPTLSSFYARNAAEGFQNDGASGPFTYLPDNSRNAISLAKHFVAYGAALGGLNAAPSDISKRTMFEYYLKPWKAFGNAGGRAAMASHQTWNRVPMHASNYLINQVFRYNTLYNFTEGFFVSDASDIGVLQAYRIAANSSQAAARGIVGGVDSDLGGITYVHLDESISDGFLNESQIDKSVARILAAKFATGLFDNFTYITDTNKWKTVLNSESSQQLAYESVLQGLTLLKVNTNMFKNSYSLKEMNANDALKNIAIIGPNAQASPITMNGPYSQWNTQSNVTILNVYQAFENQYKNIKFVYEQGVDIQSNKTNGITAAVNAAKSSDATIIVLGDNGNSAKDNGTCVEWGDNDNLDPPGQQLTLLNAVASALKGSNKPLILVLIHGRPFTFGANDGNAVLNDIDLFYSAWRPGQMGAEAIRDSIMGVSENSGRLAQSWPRSVGDIMSGAAPFLQEIRGKWVSNNRSPPDLDGRRYDTYQNEQNMLGQTADPLFALGYGLSNTGCNFVKNQIEYTDLTVMKINNNKDFVFSVSLMVKNGCNVGATDVVEIYLVDPPILSMDIVLVRYWKRIIGFQKVYVEAGGSVKVSVDIRFDDVAMFLDETYTKFEVYPGNYTVRVGPNSRADSVVAYIQL